MWFHEVPGLDTDDIGRCVWGNLLSVDHEFIANARTDIPALVAEVHRLREQLKQEKTT